jgi:hypothetical protein
MSVSLLEVIGAAGYDIENNYDDMQWFLSKQNEFDELVEQVQDVIEAADDEELDSESLLASSDARWFDEGR